MDLPRAKYLSELQYLVYELGVLHVQRTVDHIDVIEEILFFCNELQEHDAHRPDVHFLRLSLLAQQRLQGHESFGAYLVGTDNSLALLYVFVKR